MGKTGGFTLLEVLLAVVVLASGLVFILGALTIALSGGGINEAELIAVNLAQEKIESIRNTAYGSIAEEEKAVVSGFPAFQREVTLITPRDNLKEVTVNVYFMVKSAENKVSLVTYVSNS